VVLALNDHLLKGAGVLPGAVTGKLSDFAGMIVAPVLLAALLRVRTRRGLLACCAAVGAVFAGINLSHGVADAWTWLMGFVWPWHITVDPTDLVALPALALGWRALVPAMERPLSPMVPRYAEASAVAIGGFFCVATSDNDHGDSSFDEGDWGEESGTDTWTTDVDYEDFEADVYLHNASDRGHPRAHAPAAAGRAARLPRGRGGPGPAAVRVAVRRGPDGVAAAEHQHRGARPVRPARLSRGARRGRRVRGAVRAVLGRPATSRSSGSTATSTIPSCTPRAPCCSPRTPTSRIRVLESRSPVVFSVRDVPPEGAVYPGPDEQRLAWSDPPFGEHQLLAVEVGPGRLRRRDGRRPATRAGTCACRRAPSRSRRTSGSASTTTSGRSTSAGSPTRRTRSRCPSRS
jgi:hypothetical protein